MTQSNYGIKTTQQGIGVDLASDFQQNLNSSWPTLEVYTEIVVDKYISTNTTGNLSVTIFKHSLGYIPAFQWEPSDTTDFFYNISATHDEIIFYREVYSTPYELQVKGILRIFNWDITQEFLADSTSISTELPKPSEYGIAILNKDARDIESGEYQDFTLHSGAKSLAIHQSGLVYSGADSGVYTIEHKLGYMPSYQLYYVQIIGQLISGPEDFPTIQKIKSNITKVRATQIGYINGQQDGNSGAFISTGTVRELSIRGAQAVYAGVVGYIIFKDPVLKTDS